MVINTNLSAAQSGRLLADSSQMLSRSLARLASGNRITSPADDAAGLGQSAKLNAQVKRIDAALDNNANLISFLQTQSGFLNKVKTALDRMSELTVLAKDITKTDEDVALYEKEFSQISAAIHAITTRDFNGIELFSDDALNPVTDGEGGSSTLAAVNLAGATGAGNGSFTIKLEFADDSLADDQKDLLRSAAARWQSIVTGDIGGEGVDDTVVTVTTFTGAVGGLLATGSQDSVYTGTKTSAEGTINIDLADVDAFDDNFLYAVYVHEFGHVLGIGSAWDASLVSGGNYIGSNGVEQYNEIFGTSVTGFAVENDGGGGTANVHPEEDLLDNEIMTGFAETPGTQQPLSKISIGFLEDLGYAVDYHQADEYDGPGTGTGPRRGLSVYDITGVKNAVENVAKLMATVGGQTSKALMVHEQLAIEKENLSAATSRIIDTNIAEESARYSKAQILVNSGTAMLAQANLLPSIALQLLAA